MRFRQLFSKITALALLILFSLQAGLELWLHHTLHPHPAKTPTDFKDYWPEV